MNLGDTVKMQMFTEQEFGEEVDLWKEFEREQKQLCRQTFEVVQQGPSVSRPKEGLAIESPQSEAKFWRERA